MRCIIARPQLEDGHTRIANELLEQLMKRYISPNQWQILVCIIRKTYGFGKKVDYIANFQIQKDTGLSKTVVSRALKRLTDNKIIKRKGKHIGIQKDWEQWLPKLSTLGIKLAEQSTKKVSSSANKSWQSCQPELAEQSTKVSSPVVTQKKKETIQKKLYKRKGEFNNILLTDEEYKKLIDRFGENNTLALIEELSIAIKSKGYKYKDHYATILSWHRRKEGSNVGKPNPRSIPSRYTRPEDI